MTTDLQKSWEKIDDIEKFDIDVKLHNYEIYKKIKFL
jgi:hypothetical protein